MTDLDVIADALNVAVETGDTEPVAPYFAPGAVIWHNNDHVALDATEALRRAAVLHDLADAVSVRVTRRMTFPGGFVQQFVLEGKVRASGSPLELHNCTIVTIDAGLVTRIDEYVDPTAGAQFAAAGR